MAESETSKTLVHAQIISETENNRETVKWQRRLLPFMIRTIVVLSVFFFAASCIQLIYLHNVIKHIPEFDSKEALSHLNVSPGASFHDLLEATRLKSLVMLEGSSMQHQYHQAGVLLMARIWVNYMGFVTGMILATVGSTFVLGKLREPVSEVSSNALNTNFSIKSASPGLVLAVFGTILMVTSIITHHRIDVNDTSLYMRNYQVDHSGDAVENIPTLDSLTNKH